MMETQRDYELITEPFLEGWLWDSNTSLDKEVEISLLVEKPCLNELLVAAHSAQKVDPMTSLDPRDFELESCRALAEKIRSVLDHGAGFVIINDFPIKQFDDDTVRRIYWLLMSLLSRPVAQRFNGELVYDVVDEGVEPVLGKGIRSSKTAVRQVFHTDNHVCPPQYVALLCLHTAKSGGQSGLINLYTVYNQLLDGHRETIPRMYKPFLFDRQKEHALEDKLVSRNPIFEVNNGRLEVRVATSLIRQGYKLTGAELDIETTEALDALDEVMEAPGLGKTFDFKPGQIQIVNNKRIGHRRTDFLDWPEAERKRHLLRLWLRDQGAPSFLG
jgi:alpha-ketoglutarate-dependent taurine dioxygenase